MIVKASTKSEDLAFLEEIMADDEFAGLPAATQDKLKIYKRGLWGERDTAHMIDRYFHGATNTAVIHDLRLPDGMGGFAQFDHLILNRMAELATIVEVKNYAGTLSKNEHDDWIVWYKGQRQPKEIPNPVAQAKRQREVLRTWMRQHGLGRAFPNISVFVSVPPACKIDRSKVGRDVPIVKSDNLFAAWESSWDISGLDILLSPRISSLDLQRLATILARAHVPGPDIYDQLGLRPALQEDDIDQESAAVAVADEDDLAAPLTSTIIEALPAPVAEIGIGEAVPLVPVTTVSASFEHSRRRTSPICELTAGINERVLPDGRISFAAAAGNEQAQQRLDAACEGRATWVSRYRNWVCDDDRALEIRAILLASDGESTLSMAVQEYEKKQPAEVAPDDSPSKSNAKRKAGTAVIVCSGITERLLPDSRVAFRALTDNQSAKDALVSACKGRGRWQPLFKNWVVDADKADQVRTLLQQSTHTEPATHRSQVGSLTTIHISGDGLDGAR